MPPCGKSKALDVCRFVPVWHIPVLHMSLHCHWARQEVHNDTSVLYRYSGVVQGPCPCLE